MRGWVFKILYREFLTRRRRKSRLVDAGIAEDALSEPARQFGRAHCRDVLSALTRLPDEQRAAVTLVAVEDVAYDEAARILGVPVGTLRSRLSRGRAALREAFDAPAGETADSALLTDPPEPNAAPVLRRVK